MSSKKSGITFISTLIFLAISSFAATSAYTDKDCLSCHGKPNLSQILGDGSIRSLYVNAEEWSEDVHQKVRITCVECHINAKPYIHFREGFIDASCENCHRIEAEEYQRNVHFEFAPLAFGRELPRCYHCHTRHHVLKLDDPKASINERNLEDSCGECHAEVMVRSLLKGTSLGKISGHRKGDASERFDMKVCIACHSPQHSTARVVQDFCTRCHDAQKKAGFFLGPTHLDSQKWAGLNYAGGGLAFLLLVGTGVFVGFKARKSIFAKCRAWLKNMEKEVIEKEKKEPAEIVATEKESQSPEKKY